MPHPPPTSHPCLHCGACCAFFRVAFYWREAEKSEISDPVPLPLTEDYSSVLRNMRGTNEKHHARCVALEGKIGKAVSCSIYLLRPSPCREFQASFENGEPNPRCDQARNRHGLAPLQRKDWANTSAFARGNPAATLGGNKELPPSDNL